MRPVGHQVPDDGSQLYKGTAQYIRNQHIILPVAANFFRETHIETIQAIIVAGVIACGFQCLRVDIDGSYIVCPQCQCRDRE